MRISLQQNFSEKTKLNDVIKNIVLQEEVPCEQCDGGASQRSDSESPPPKVLWMHMQDSKNVNFDCNLEFRMSNYKLTGIVSRPLGYTGFIAFVLNPEDEHWYEIKDSVVKEVSVDIVLSTKAYLLFYSYHLLKNYDPPEPSIPIPSDKKGKTREPSQPSCSEGASTSISKSKKKAKKKKDEKKRKRKMSSSLSIEEPKEKKKKKKKHKK